MGQQKELAVEIMELLKKRKDMPYEYINPHFLASIAGALRDYGKIEDDEVWDWVQGMYSA